MERNTLHHFTTHAMAGPKPCSVHIIHAVSHGVPSPSQFVVPWTWVDHTWSLHLELRLAAAGWLGGFGNPPPPASWLAGAPPENSQNT